MVTVKYIYITISITVLSLCTSVAGKAKDSVRFTAPKGMDNTFLGAAKVCEGYCKNCGGWASLWDCQTKQIIINAGTSKARSAFIPQDCVCHCQGKCVRVKK